MMRRALVLSLAAMTLIACSKDNKKVDPPAELVDFEPSLQVDRVWQASVGGDDPVMRLGLGLGLGEDRVYAAGASGDVVALALSNGRSVWRTKTKTSLGGGVGVGADLVAVGSQEGEVIALEAASGAIRWRVRVTGEVLSAPAVGAGVVVVRTVDGKLLGLDVADGHELWREEQQVPRLSLRGTARPVIVGDIALCGFDSGRVMALNAADGAVLWEAAVAPARGRTELERLVDIDSAVRVIDNDIYVVGFQGRAAMLAIDSGQVWWSRELSSSRGLDVDAEDVVVSTSDGDVVSLKRRTGVEVWRQDALKRRNLSPPALVGAAVAVADFDGYVHWLDRSTGAMLARTRVGSRVSNAPLVANGLMVLIDDQGKLAAFRPRFAAPEAAAPPVVPADSSAAEAPPASGS